MGSDAALSKAFSRQGGVDTEPLPWQRHAAARQPLSRELPGRELRPLCSRGDPPMREAIGTPLDLAKTRSGSA